MKYQVAIIGGGPAGYTAAEAAGKVGLSVVLFEKQSLGGVCLNEGCIRPRPMTEPAMLQSMRSVCPKYRLICPRLLPASRR